MNLHNKIMSIKRIEKKVLAGKRLSSEDAIALFESEDIFSIGRLAAYAAHKHNGNNAYFIQNHHVNPTNICVNRCKFCAFSRSKGDKGAYELDIKTIIRKLRSKATSHKGNALKFAEVHIVGGMHPDWPFEHYLNIIREVKKNFPVMHIKAFTAVEIDYFSKISNMSVNQTLLALKEAGLETMPGGGAEIFSPGVRKKICPEKITGRRWLQIMESAHKAGIRTNATMLYGHLEGVKHRVDHMLRLRDLQDRTGGFQAFIPLAFHPVNTEIKGAKYTSGIDDLKTIAISRLFLDNFAHIKAYWVMLGEKIAQLALMFGADDLDGTIVEEKITRSAGALSGGSLTRDDLINLIEKAGKVPVERDSFYNKINIRGRN